MRTDIIEINQVIASMEDFTVGAYITFLRLPDGICTANGMVFEVMAVDLPFVIMNAVNCPGEPVVFDMRTGGMCKAVTDDYARAYGWQVEGDAAPDIGLSPAEQAIADSMFGHPLTAEEFDEKAPTWVIHDEVGQDKPMSRKLVKSAGLVKDEWPFLNGAVEKLNDAIAAWDTRVGTGQGREYNDSMKAMALDLFTGLYTLSEGVVVAADDHSWEWVVLSDHELARDVTRWVGVGTVVTWDAD